MDLSIISNFGWMVISGIMGASWGSFAHVVYYRTPLMYASWIKKEKMTLWWSFPGSHCPKCNTNLSWFENFPVFGWLFLRGKCRHCKEVIPIRYWLWECCWLSAGVLLGWLVGVWSIVIYLLATFLMVIIEFVWKRMAKDLNLLK